MDLLIPAKLRIVRNVNISTFQSAGKYAAWRFAEDVHILDPFEFEIIEWEWWADTVAEQWDFCIYIGLAYLLSVLALQHYMKGRDPYGLKRPLALWNGALGVFSVVGFARSWPAFYNILSTEGGFYHSMCTREGGNMPAAFWALMFILSKFIELGDTAFIILRKRPLVFLQWYHHLMTMVVAWIVGPFLEPITRWYTIMNYGVHSLMYPYFALKALDVWIPRQISNTITTLQLSQMIMGLFVNFYTMVLISQGVDCYRHPLSMKIFILVYGSFTLLFGRLFHQALFSTKKKKTM